MNSSPISFPVISYLITADPSLFNDVTMIFDAILRGNSSPICFPVICHLISVDNCLFSDVIVILDAI